MDGYISEKIRGLLPPGRAFCEMMVEFGVNIGITLRIDWRLGRDIRVLLDENFFFSIHVLCKEDYWINSAM